MNNSRRRQAFHRDGNLRDIQVQNVTLEHWERFIDFIRSSGLGYRYARDGAAARLPSTAAQILGDRSATHNLAIDLGGATACCHFFTEDEIELDIDPREVGSPVTEQNVLKFIVMMGAQLDRDVILTQENRRDEVWFRYSSKDDLVQSVKPA